MDLKTFGKCRALIAFLLAAVIGASTAGGIPIVPAVAVLVGTVAMYFCRKQVKEVLVDERMERVSEKAAKLVFNVYLVAAGLFSVLVISLGREYVQYLDTAYFLSYSVCALLLLQLAAYGYYDRNMG